MLNICMLIQKIKVRYLPRQWTSSHKFMKMKGTNDSFIIKPPWSFPSWSWGGGSGHSLWMSIWTMKRMSNWEQDKNDRAFWSRKDIYLLPNQRTPFLFLCYGGFFNYAHGILSIGWNLGLFSSFLLLISPTLFVSALRGTSRTPIIPALFCQSCCSSGKK